MTTKTEAPGVVHVTPEEIAGMNREQLIEALMWIGPEGKIVRPRFRESLGKEDWPYNVGIEGDPAVYTDDELRQLLAFSEEMTAKYDQMFRYRRGCNLILLHRYPGEEFWYRRRETWEYGYMWSSTLEDALDTFRDEPAAEWKIRCLDALYAGDEEAAFEIYFEKRCGDLGIRYSAVPTEADAADREAIMVEFRDGKYADGSRACRTIEELRGRVQSRREGEKLGLRDRGWKR